MTWQEALSDYYAHHETLDELNRAWLTEKVLLDAPLLSDTDLETAVLLALVTRNNEVNHTLLVYTLVWQTMGLILAGKEDPIEGNVRSFWYTFADPLYSHHRLYKSLRQDPGFQAYLDELEEEGRYRVTRAQLAGNAKIQAKYCKKLCEDAIQQFVRMRIFRYQGPYQFIDHKAEYRLLGEKRASLVFFLEKEGLFKRYGERYNGWWGISALASQGYPSNLTLEYFADQLRSKKIKKVALAGLVDYDPSGFGIAESYKEMFESQGFGIKDFTILTSVELFTETVLTKQYEDFTHVPKNKEKQVQAWFARTNGIHGQRRGVHVNLAQRSRVDKVMKQWYKAQLDRLRTEEP